ncbi:MAG: hypothetical protein QXJ17_08840 [Nitrososphaeria archaeon]
MQPIVFNWKYVKQVSKLVAVIGKNDKRRELYVIDPKNKTPMIIDIPESMTPPKVNEGETYKITFDIYSSKIPKEYIEQIKKPGDKEIEEAVKNLKLLKNHIYKCVLVDIRTKYFDYAKSKAEKQFDELKKKSSIYKI